ncbi:VanZ family protein [Capillimicrobium parvum]|nr:VanZ family protein [Capillimicrobium parvum]
MDSTATADRMTRVLRIAPPVALMALIWYLSSQPDVGPDLGAWARLATSAVHFGQFAVLFALWWWALDRRALPAALITLAWAGLDEIHQSWVPRRDADPIDFAVDAAGILAAWLVLRAATARSERRGTG